MTQVTNIVAVRVWIICFLQIIDSETKCQILTFFPVFAEKHWQVLISAYEMQIDRFEFFYVK